MVHSWKIWISLFLLTLCFGANSFGEDLPPKATLSLNFPTHLNNVLADWDSVWAWIVQDSSRIDSVKLDTTGNPAGQYWGRIDLDGYTPGSYNKLYCAFYGSYILCDLLSFSVIDTTELQGSASGLTITDIREAVHFAFTATYGGSTGTMGKAIVDAASCNPTGSNTIIIRLKRDSDSTAIIGGWVEVKTDGTSYYIGDTDNDGKVQFSSDNDTLFVYPKSHPITFTHPETLFIDGNEDTTYYGTPHSPSSPPADTLCVVYVYVKTSQGVAIQGAKVTIWGSASNVKYGNVVIDYQKKVMKRTDADGKAEFSKGFYPNDVLTPSDLLYHYRIETAHYVADGTFEVPIADSYELPIEP